MKKISSVYRANAGLPDTGTYQGKISGYEVVFYINDIEYMFRVDDGIRGINIPVTVTIHKGEIFSVEVINDTLI